MPSDNALAGALAGASAAFAGAAATSLSHHHDVLGAICGLVAVGALTWGASLSAAARRRRRGG